MNYDWTRDMLALAAMGVPGAGPAMPQWPKAPAVPSGAGPTIRRSDLNGDLTANAARLGVPVEDLVAMRLQVVGRG